MESKLPENFKGLIVDFTKDLTNTFDDYSYLWNKYYAEDAPEDIFVSLFEYSKTVYPQRFFDILYQNEDIFKEDAEENTHFLPNVSFKLLFSCEGITENTKKAIWKYLQLVLFTVVNEVKDKSMFGDCANMFDGIDESALQDKLQETMEGIGEFFAKIDDNEDIDKETKEKMEETKNNIDEMMDEMPDLENIRNSFGGKMPNLENLQDNLRNMFNGKIGSLAKEMAEEIADDFKDLVDENDVQNPQDVIKKLMQNPSKISNLMKTVGAKLDDKMKSGDISKEELMKEASEMMNQMNGEGEMGDMLKNLMKNMGGLGKNMKFDTNKMDRMTKRESTISKMKEKVDIKKRQQEIELERIKLQQQEQINLQNELRAKYSLDETGENNFVFKLDGVDAEKTFIHPDLLKDIEEEEKNATQKKSQPQKKAVKKKKKGKK
uniref:Uncharacterized protein n=1 Tax=viral metagenome TaxID=1070528 RepID=A0A6C0IRS3_9ZZZZ